MNNELFDDFETSLFLPFLDQPEEAESGEGETNETTTKEDEALNQLFGSDNEDLDEEGRVNLDKKLSLKIIALARVLDTLQQKLSRMVANDTRYLQQLDFLSKIRSDYAFFIDNLEFYEASQIKKIIKKFEQVISNFVQQL